MQHCSALRLVLPSSSGVNHAALYVGHEAQALSGRLRRHVYSVLSVAAVLAISYVRTPAALINAAAGATLSFPAVSAHSGRIRRFISTFRVDGCRVYLAN